MAGRTLKLTPPLTGLQFPQIGFGTWQAKPGEVEKAVEEAIKIGYRHIDAALVYENQAEVGEGIKRSGIKREDIWITSKLWNNSHHPKDVEADLDLTLKQLGTDYLDLYLIHWPFSFKAGSDLLPLGEDGKIVIDWDGPSLVDTWKEVVRIQKETKKVRAIGVSNFTIEDIESLKASGDLPTPSVLQIEANPGVIQPELYDYAKKNNIVITAYSTFGNNITGKPRILHSDVVATIAKRLNKEPAQVLIAWALKRGFAVIPKSVTAARIKSNFETFDLSDEDFKLLEDWGAKNYARASVPSSYSPSWPINVFGEKEEQQYQQYKKSA